MTGRYQIAMFDATAIIYVKRTIKTYLLTARILSLPIRGPALPSVVNQIPIHFYHGWQGRPTDKEAWPLVK